MAGGTLRIKNISPSTIEVSVDTTTVAQIPGSLGATGQGQYGGGSSAYVQIAPGAIASWERSADGAYRIVIGRVAPTGYQDVLLPGQTLTYIGPGYPSFGLLTYRDISLEEIKEQDRKVSMGYVSDLPRYPYRNGAAKEGTFYYVLRGKQSGKAMTIQSASSNDGDPAVLSSIVYSDQQLWRFDRSGDGDYYYVINKKSGKALTVHGGGTEDGAYLDQWTLLNQDNQKWTADFLEPDLYAPFALISKISNSLATVHGGGSVDGTIIDQWHNCGSVNQHWYLG